MGAPPPISPPHPTIEQSALPTDSRVVLGVSLRVDEELKVEDINALEELEESHPRLFQFLEKLFDAAKNNE